MKKHKSFFSFCLALFPILGLLAAPQAAQPVFAGAGRSAIAYFLPNDTTGDEIHLIDTDGTHDREIWHTGTSRLTTEPDVTQLAWKPDASELAFTSSHEAGCSLYQADIYAIRSDGLDYRRVSGPPACGSLGNLPTGTVRVPVENWTDEIAPFTIYFEGAPGPIEVSVLPGQLVTLTFHNVADYGDQLQYAVAIYGEVRVFDLDARVDVLPGATLETGILSIGTGFEHFGFQWPTYTPDGSKIASIFNKGELYQVDANNREPGVAGGPLPVSMPLSSDFLTWSPTAARAGQFLYEGWQDSDTIFLGDANSSSSQLIMTIDPLRIGKTLLGLAWLPDGSGFLYSVTEMVNYVYIADLFEYTFATGESTRLTDLSYGFIRRITISPDGQKIVYEYQQSADWYDPNRAIDLWIMNRDGSQAALFVENGRAPAWSPKPLPVLPPPTQPQPIPTLPPLADLPFRLMLPAITR